MTALKKKPTKRSRPPCPKISIDQCRILIATTRRPKPLAEILWSARMRHLDTSQATTLLTGLKVAGYVERAVECGEHFWRLTELGLTEKEDFRDVLRRISPEGSAA